MYVVYNKLPSNMSSYRAIYKDKLRLTTQFTVDIFVRCHSQQCQDDNAANPDNL